MPLQIKENCLNTINTVPKFHKAGFVKTVPLVYTHYEKKCLSLSTQVTKGTVFRRHTVVSYITDLRQEIFFPHFAPGNLALDCLKKNPILLPFSPKKTEKY